MKFPLIGLALFLLGGGSAWLLKSNLRVGVSKSTAPPAVRASRPEATVRTVTDADRRRIGDMLANFKPINSFDPGPGKPDTSSPELEGVADYPGLLDALLERAGLVGLQHKESELLRKLLAAWFHKEPAAAVKWVRSLQPDGDRMEFGSQLVANAMKTDYDEAVRLAGILLLDDQGIVRIPEELLAASIAKGAQALLSLLAISAGNGQSGSNPFPATFPQEFGFQEALDGLAALEGKGIHPSAVPWNLLDEWAKHDPDAAFAWAVNRQAIPAGLGMDSYFSGLSSPDERAAALARACSGDHAHPKLFLGLDYVLAEMEANDLDAVLSRLPPDVDPLKARGGLLAPTNDIGKELDSYRKALLASLNPDQRVAVVKSLLSASGDDTWTQRGRDSLNRALSELGHPAVQLTELIPPAAKPDPPEFRIVTTVGFGSGFIEGDDEELPVNPE